MGGWLPIAVTIATVGLLILSGFWANKRFADFEMLPGHYDWAGRGTRMTPRKTMVWLLPIMFSVMMIALSSMLYWVPQEYGSAGPLPWQIFTAFTLLGSQLFVLWLADRWAKQHGGNR